MGLMLPHPSKADTEGTLGGRNPTLEGKMACMSVAGYAACAKSNVALDSVLDEIKVGGRFRGKFLSNGRLYARTHGIRGT